MLYVVRFGGAGADLELDERVEHVLGEARQAHALDALTAIALVCSLQKFALAMEVLLADEGLAALSLTQNAAAASCQSFLVKIASG